MVRLAAMLCLYNELEKDNLVRCLYHLNKVVDKIFIYDDGSTDASKTVYNQYDCEVIYGDGPDFKDELRHKNLLLDRCKAWNADWVLIMDGDEVVSKSGIEGGIRRLCELGEKHLVYLWSLFYWNIWRSNTWHRIDYLGNGWFPRLFKCFPNSHFKQGQGLHLDLSPQGVGKRHHSGIQTACILHYGYSTQEHIERRWIERTKLEVPKEWRIKGIQEQDMELIDIPQTFFPEELWVENEPAPKPIKYEKLHKEGWV